MKYIFMKFRPSFVFLTALSQADHITLHSDILLFSGGKPFPVTDSKMPVPSPWDTNKRKGGPKWVLSDLLTAGSIKMMLFHQGKGKK